MALFYQDYLDMFDCLEAQGADFLIVGAFAMAHFGYIRATGDIDIWVAATESNSPKVFQALKVFGSPLFEIHENYFSKSGNFLQIGLPPSRIDILTKIDGVSHQDAFSSK